MSGKIGVCSVCGREGLTYAVPFRKDTRFCRKHIEQLKRYGYTLDCNARTVYDRNEIRLFGDYAEIDTYDGKGNVVYTYKMDLEDITLLGDRKWRTVIKGKKCSPYLVTGHAGIQGDMVYFHRMVMGSPDCEVDHINRDTLDNRKRNLRLANRYEQVLNTCVRSDNTLGMKGVYFVKERKSYKSGFCAQICSNNVRINSKTFDSLSEACYFRYLCEISFFGKVLNSKKLLDGFENLSCFKKKEIEDYFSSVYNRVVSGIKYIPKGRPKKNIV